jgi:hypothetical protein
MPFNAHIHSPPSSVARLKGIAQFLVQPDPGAPDEWFLLRSTVLSNEQLFAMLRAAWPAVVGPEPHKFALLHCRTGPNAGVWFHLLPNAEYEPGCHEVVSF